MRAAIYLRISQDKTGEEAGVTRQQEDCAALADELGWQVVEIYRDNDISATSSKPRPAYRRMLADVAAGRIDAVISWHTDRLYRTMRDLEELVNVVEGHSLIIRTIRAGDIDLANPTGRMLARILGATAQHEVEQKADRWQRSIRQRREAGKWWNSASRAFGRNRDGTLIDGEAEALRHVCRELIIKEGSGINRCCHWLNDNGWSTTRGNPWSPSSLRVTLRSPKVAGLSALNGVIVGLGDWEPILERDEWERVLAVLDSRKFANKVAPRRALLTGLVYCGVDGCDRQLYRSKRGYTMFRCATELKANGHVSIAADRLDEMVEAAARQALSGDNIRRAIANRLSSAGTAADQLIQEIDAVEQELLALDAAMQEAESARSKLSITRAIDELDAQLTQKRVQLSGLTSVPLPFGDEWPEDLDRRSALIRLVVARVVVNQTSVRGRFDPARVEIVPTFADV